MSFLDIGRVGKMTDLMRLVMAIAFGMLVACLLYLSLKFGLVRENR